MRVEFGNVAPKNGIKEEVNPKDHSADELRQMAQSRGIPLVGDENKELVARYLSDTPVFHDIAGPATSTFITPDDWDAMETFQAITAPVRGFWVNHSNAAPAWISTDDPLLATLLCQYFKCENKTPEDVESTHHTLFGPPGVGPDGPIEKDES